jgi:hypothetical protein
LTVIQKLGICGCSQGQSRHRAGPSSRCGHSVWRSGNRHAASR